MTEHYTIYTDATGRPLEIGQTIVYCLAGTSKAMRMAKVTRIIPKTVELDAPRQSWEKPLRRDHSAVAVVRGVDE